MTDPPHRAFDGLRILVVEDDFILALDLQLALEDAGAVVIGPVPSVAEALALLESAPVLDGAILDVNLHGEVVFPVAGILHGRGIPLAFTTGYDSDILPRAFADAPCFEKPFSIAQCLNTLSETIQRAAMTSGKDLGNGCSRIGR